MFSEIRKLVARFQINSGFGITDYRNPHHQMKQYWRYNQDERLDNEGIGKEPNVGDRPDWYTDAIFGQQFFTGPNPTSITLAPKNVAPNDEKNPRWVEQFLEAAYNQDNQEVVSLLSNCDDEFYVADYSYFRKDLGIPDGNAITAGDLNPRSSCPRYGCAAVALFRLFKGKGAGKLHPLAIILDYKSRIENSVVIFNQRLSPEDPSTTEATDWPWRYAKTCVMVSDWAHHEIVVHLVNTHLVQEVVIVAANRSFSRNSGIFRLLEAHWDKTLALNLAARQTLIPAVIIPICPFPLPLVYQLINKTYLQFDWRKNAIPNDLVARGFDAAGDWEPSNKKFHNYGYARNMRDLWGVLRKFVSLYLSSFPEYKTDQSIKENEEIKKWVNEMRGAKCGNLQSFPETIETRDQLVDALTMCIHIASPQHTAINYLQNYYQAFVAAKPPALYKPLPETLEQLKKYGESHLVEALPILGGSHWKLASYLSYLLSLQGKGDTTLLDYAESLASGKGIKKHADLPPLDKSIQDAIKKAGTQFKSALTGLSKKFKDYNKDIDAIPQLPDIEQYRYTVLDPGKTTSSILI